MPDSQMLEEGDSTVWRPRDGVLLLASSTRVVLLGPESGQPIVLEGVAKAIWHALGRGNSSAGVVATVLREFDVPDDIAVAEVSTFLHSLREHGILMAAGTTA